MFHIEMWIYVHDIATMLATSYLEWDETFISKVITDGYGGMKIRYFGGGIMRRKEVLFCLDNIPQVEYNLNKRPIC